MEEKNKKTKGFQHKIYVLAWLFFSPSSHLEIVLNLSVVPLLSVSIRRWSGIYASVFNDRVVVVVVVVILEM